MQKTHILFLCTGNSCRSQMAEGIARATGRGRIAALGPSQPARRRLHEGARDRPGAQRSKGLDELPAGVTWDAVVTMGCGDACPHLPAKTRLDWDLQDPKAMSDDDVRRVRDRIDTLVSERVKVKCVAPGPPSPPLVS